MERRLISGLASVAVILALIALAGYVVRQDTKVQKWRQDCLNRGGVPVSHYKAGTSGRELVAVCQRPQGQP